MGEAELDKPTGILRIRATLVLYGGMASDELAAIVAADVAKCWNEPKASVRIGDSWYTLDFSIYGRYEPGLKPMDVFLNSDPRLNYFRVEEKARGNISFVDAINSNTGYFQLENLLHHSSTAAHEFGHTLGLEHPAMLDIRGQGIPGIMYPRGSIVDPPFQYYPTAAPGADGGTLNPHLRKVLIDDINNLKLHKLHFDSNGRAVLGDFTSVWHDAHVD